MSRKTEHATGALAPWAYGLSRIMVTLPHDIFTEIKISALKNNRSLSAEMRARLESSFARVEVSQ